MFQRSETEYGVKYGINDIGDCDTKTFKCLINSAPYGKDFIVKKKECILHVKKRMFRRAKEVKKKNKLLNWKKQE